MIPMIPCDLKRRDTQELVFVISGQERVVPARPDIRRVDLVRSPPNRQLSPSLEIEIAERGLSVSFANVPGQVRTSAEVLTLYPSIEESPDPKHLLWLGGQPERANREASLPRKRQVLREERGAK